MLRPYDVIKRKRDGDKLSGEQIAHFLDGYLQGEVPDYQMSALLMAVYFHGLDPEELAVWASRMLHSGTVLDLGEIPGRKVDKHSTGGVGDKISIPLAPLVAACGVRVPMISGRGLGHTGGTLDKLESIPGFDVNLSVASFRRAVADIGVCMIGQTADIAPLDRRLYALRDVTATVDSIPLISSSIMSKKLAEGIDALVLDVKVGSGAFMKTEADARTLARTMVDIGAQMDKKVIAVLTDMNQPLGRTVGNALEIAESVEVLRGGGPEDIVELVLALGAEMLVLGGEAVDADAARTRLKRALADGSGLRKFKEMVALHGGDARVADDLDVLPRASDAVVLTAGRAGFIRAVDTEQVGIAGMLLGAGRARVDSPIDPAVGLTVHARIGDEVEEDSPLVTLHVNDRAELDRAREMLHNAYTIGEEEPPRRPLIIDVIE